MPFVSSQIGDIAARIRAALGREMETCAGLEQVLAFVAADKTWTHQPLPVTLKKMAYVLATVFHETAFTFAPVVERGGRRYFDRYEPDTAIGKRLGNTDPGDGFRYRGRGYVQITGRANYLRMAGRLGVDLLNQPEKACEPAIAYRILVEGMWDGLFTGKSLGEYFRLGGEDWVNARRIINGQDRAETIAGYALKILDALEACITQSASASA